MANLGRYCKAYPISRFREFVGWSEKNDNARKEKKNVDGVDVEAPRELTDKDYLYLQENFTVTDGIFLDENIIFDQVDEDWVDYCKTKLNFQVPTYEPIKAEAGNSAS